MPLDRPPSIDPVAAARWARGAPAASPWLHEEVGRRMEERLQWIRQVPALWVDWEPVRGGLATHALVAERYPRSPCVVHEAPSRLEAARQALGRPWWKGWGGAPVRFDAAAPGQAALLWSNMLLHMAADPPALMAQWHAALAVDGMLMFSCFGPDTLRELRAVYAGLGWPPACHDFTDMHDWGDMLVASGFAEPVMDMERITLTFDSPARLLQELRELGANLHPARFPALRGRGWRQQLENALAEGLRQPDGKLALGFEIIYGHAVKPAPRARVDAQSEISVTDMRAMLRSGRAPRS